MTKRATSNGASHRRPCFLRETKLELRDGETYTFRALPFSPRNIGAVKLLLGLEKKKSIPTSEALHAMEVLAEAVEQSLSYDQDAETVRYLIDHGVVPTFPTEGDKLAEQVMQALMAGAGGS